MLVRKNWLLVAFIVLLSVSLASLTFIARLDLESEIFVLVGKPVVVHCPFQSLPGYIWEIDDKNYSLGELPKEFNAVKDERHCDSSLNFTATKKLNGTAIRCVNSDRTKRSNVSVLRVQGCVVDLRPARMLDSESVELDWESGCEESHSVRHLEIECSSVEEYRRVRLPSKLKHTTLMGLMPWTHFELRVTVVDELGASWKSNPIKLMTRKAGIPPPPQFLSLSARAVPHEEGHEGGHGGVEVFFSACDRGQILRYTIEVAMDVNFTHIIDNGTVQVGNGTRKAEVDGLQTNTTYWMRMKAIGPGGESVYSAAQSVNTLEVVADPGVSMTTVIEEMKSSGLLISTIVLAILFVISGLVAVYICLYLRYQKTQRRSSTEQNESRFVDVGKTSTLDKIRHSDENSKTVPDSPGVSVPDLTTEDSTQNLAQNGEVKMTSRTPSKQHSNGYINGTFYQL